MKLFEDDKHLLDLIHQAIESSKEPEPKSLSHILKDHLNVPKNISNYDNLSPEAKYAQYSNLSAEIHSLHHPYGIDDDVRDNLHWYTRESANNGPNSRLLNSAIATDKENISSKYAKVDNTIMTHSKPLGDTYHLYSGVHSTFMDNIHPGTIVHSPFHISTSLSPSIAKEFMKSKNSKDILHIKTDAKTKGIPMTHVSKYPEESEVVLPRGTSFKYTHTTKHDDGIKVHHFEIHHDT